MASHGLSGPRPEAVKAMRVAADGVCEILVQWKDTYASSDTWEAVFVSEDAGPDVEACLAEQLPQLPLPLSAAQPFGEQSWITRVASDSRNVALPEYVHVSASRWSLGSPAPLDEFVVGCECVGREDERREDAGSAESCAVPIGKEGNAAPGSAVRSPWAWDECALRAPVCTRTCCCASQTTDGKSAYDAHGRLCAEAGTCVSECNERCGCGPACPFRVMQRGRTLVLELAWMGAASRGWGVRAATVIEGPGVFVERYLGEIISGAEAARRAAAGHGAYIFDLDFASGAGASKSAAAEYCIDARRYGNVARFFNHSCEPNMRVVATLIECADPRLHGIAFVTTRRVLPGEELTFDYWGGRAPRRRPRNAVPCRCGSVRCRGYVH